ncbi:4Fe-4S double cluster binding domain-containing protein, partial [Archaeoglobus sp.]
RLASILADMPLEAGTPAENRCGTCRECTDNAALYALRDSDFKSYPVGEEVFDVEKCASKPQEFAKDPDIGTMVCGICIKVCPWGARKRIKLERKIREHEGCHCQEGQRVAG